MSAEKFVGTWKLISYETRFEDGRVEYPMGNDAVGRVIYTTEGYMSGHLMRKREAGEFDINNVQSEVLNKITDHVSYTGRFEVRENTVVHFADISVFPSWVDSEQVRIFEFEGDRLKLSTGPLKISGETQSAHLIWERVTS